jgi:hypothetical protein
MSKILHALFALSALLIAPAVAAEEQVKQNRECL